LSFFFPFSGLLLEENPPPAPPFKKGEGWCPLPRRRWLKSVFPPPKGARGPPHIFPLGGGGVLFIRGVFSRRPFWVAPEICVVVIFPPPKRGFFSERNPPPFFFFCVPPRGLFFPQGAAPPERYPGGRPPAAPPGGISSLFFFGGPFSLKFFFWGPFFPHFLVGLPPPEAFFAHFFPQFLKPRLVGLFNIWINCLDIFIFLFFPHKKPFYLFFDF